MDIYSTIARNVASAETVDAAVAIVDRIDATYREPVRQALIDHLDPSADRFSVEVQHRNANRRAALRHLDRLELGRLS